MPAKDKFHELVKIALQNQDWTITHDQKHPGYKPPDSSVQK
ncbi:element excision factor XisH family protein [Microcoleus sp. S36b_A4]